MPTQKSPKKDYKTMGVTSHPIEVRQLIRRKKINTCLKQTLICLSITIAILFIVIFVVLPLVVMWSYNVQRFLMFPNIDQPSNPQFTNFQLYGARGTRNIYVSVKDIHDKDNILSLGVWHVLPQELIKESESNPNYSYDNALETSGHDVIIYCHGNSGTRIAPFSVYEKIRKWFHVIAVDYRSYGDSSPGELTEKAVVNDLTQFFKWVRSKTNANVYVWGHSLGTALCTHAVASLSDEKISPMGLVLESGFTTMREEVPYHPFAKIFYWVPWFHATILDPLQNNGFLFETSKNILKVNCPIMILHAEDDPIVPYIFGQKLFEIAQTQRNVSIQGNVTYHQFEANLGYNHLYIHMDSRLPKYIENFIDMCNHFNAGTGRIKYTL